MRVRDDIIRNNHEARYFSVYNILIAKSKNRSNPRCFVIYAPETK